MSRRPAMQTPRRNPRTPNTHVNLVVCDSFHLWHNVVFTALSLRWTAQTAAPPTLLTHCAPQNSCSANATCCRFLLLWRATTTGSSIQSNQQIAADVASGTFTQMLLQFRGFTSMTICFPPPTALCLHKRFCISPNISFKDSCWNPMQEVKLLPHLERCITRCTDY